MATESVPADQCRRFTTLWHRCSSAPGDAVTVFDQLVARYAAPARHYHTLSHILHCLDALDGLPGFPSDRDALEMAVWFHDAVYQPGASDNEQRSAELFAIDGNALPAAFVQQVIRLILVTTHRNPPSAEDEAAMVDIDLSAFGLPWAEFIRDTRNVRAELTHVADADFFPSQARFLASLLARPRLYHTGHFHSRIEATARGNIQRLLDHIASNQTLP